MKYLEITKIFMQSDSILWMISIHAAFVRKTVEKATNLLQ